MYPTQEDTYVLVEPMEGIILRTSELEPDVPVSMHLAYDILYLHMWI
ncbi:MAG: hypothetical protein ICV78_01050 [Tolypothrix sp. Co-bin9]|nr:hypothetical protein [Tolypothrix sp. Co-bin9]